MLTIGGHLVKRESALPARTARARSVRRVRAKLDLGPIGAAVDRDRLADGQAEDEHREPGRLQDPVDDEVGAVRRTGPGQSGSS